MIEDEGISIIGIDCATQPVRTGVAYARYQKGQKDLIACLNASEIEGYNSESDNMWYSLAKQCKNWIKTTKHVLFCMDAPLGWPNRMRETLPEHMAGELLGVEAHDLFNRFTDRYVKKLIKKRPLEIGASLIARTAVSALELLSTLRVVLNKDLPLLWEQGHIEGSGVIEVYPAATTIGRIDTTTKLNAKTRPAIIRSILEAEFNLESIDILGEADEHMLDAAVCVLTGIDFIDNRCHNPLRENISKQEGWIWFSS